MMLHRPFAAYALLTSFAMAAVGCGEVADDLEPMVVDETRDAGRDLGTDWGTDVAVPVLEPEAPNEPDDMPEPEGDPDDDEPCPIGASRCVDAQTFARCLRDGTWAERACPAGQLCAQAEGECRFTACSPDEWQCNPERPDDVRQCLPDGSGWRWRSCGPGSQCPDEECLHCTPGAGRCINDRTVQQCLGGDGWSDPTPCPASNLCAGGRCVRPACIVRVMLLIDRSGSMMPHWLGVSAAVDEVVRANPDVWFGLSAFPSRGGCTVGDEWPTVAPSSVGRLGIEDWMRHNAPDGGTPLNASLAWLADNRDAVWGPAPDAHLIVLTDGADSCGCVEGDGPDCLTTEMTASTERLRAAGVRTHVVGFAFRGDAAQLDTIARAGGTDRDAHIPVAGVAELATAFEALVDDIKLCPEI